MDPFSFPMYIYSGVTANNSGGEDAKMVLAILAKLAAVFAWSGANTFQENHLANTTCCLEEKRLSIEGTSAVFSMYGIS